jgi:hypothetical protein
MKKLKYNLLTISITLLSLVFIIGLAYGQEDTSPIADASSSQIVTSGKNVTLDGSNSNDPDGDGLNYYWYQIGGQNVSLSDISIANPTFIAPKVANPTILRFELIVDDNKTSSSPSYVQIRINSTPHQSSAPALSQDRSPQSPQLTQNDVETGIILLLSSKSLRP